MEILEILEEKAGFKELERVAMILNKSYNPIQLDFEIWQLLLSALGNEYKFILNRFKNETLPYKLINDIIMKYYPGERILKYNMAKKMIGKKDDIVFFEMNIDNSRVDLARITMGKDHTSVAYEIKTEFDTTKRLEKQIYDYSKVFEYIYVIIHPVHFDKVKEKIPEYCGIITYRQNEGDCVFSYRRKANKNKYIQAEAQVRNLTSNELKILLKYENIKDIPNTRMERERLIFSKCNEKKINKYFKYLIKKRYSKQWMFIYSNFNKIYPIDIQSFFHSPLDPDSFYTQSIYLSSFRL